jgi:DNA adenine methylase
VKVFHGDYERVVRKYDRRDAVHFLDPPYAGYNVQVGEDGFDEERFFKLVKSLDGKFLITYGVRGKLPGLLKAEGYNIKKIRVPRTIRTMRGVGGSSVLTQLVVSIYDVASKRWDEVQSDGVEVESDVEDPAGTTAAVPDAVGGGDAAPPPGASPTSVAERAFAKAIPLLKGVDPDDERYVLGIVLEPETVDAQGDIYSPEEIRKAAHTFMEEFRGLGLMHRLKVNDGVKILENYLAPADFRAGDVDVKKGTWLLAVRVVSDSLWRDVQSGELTGFSIGGSARRVPEGDAPADPAGGGRPS